MVARSYRCGGLRAILRPEVLRSHVRAVSTSMPLLPRWRGRPSRRPSYADEDRRNAHAADRYGSARSSRSAPPILPDDTGDLSQGWRGGGGPPPRNAYVSAAPPRHAPGRCLVTYAPC
jgi:hypothetical protein